MIITPAAITALFTGFKKIFQNALSNAETQWKRVATYVPSTTSSNTYGWLGKWPKFREWIGDRQFNDLKAHSYSITNKKFESSVAVGRDEIEDDELGIYNPMMQEMGQATAEFPDELIFGLLKDGFNQVCYDGQNFFDTEHPVYANHDGTGAATLVSNMQDGANEPWFLLDTSRSLKPLIYQERRKPNFEALTKGDDANVFMRDEYLYGVDLRAAAGFGFWQMAFASKGDLTVANFAAAREAMMNFKGDGDKKLNIKPMLLVVPPSLEAKAKKIVETQLVDGGDSNIYYKAAEVLMVNWLA